MEDDAGNEVIVRQDLAIPTGPRPLPMTVTGPYPTVIVNATPHELLVITQEERGVVRVTVTEESPGPMEQKLAELRQVLGDLVEEKIGRKAYVLRKYDSNFPSVFLRLEDAKACSTILIDGARAVTISGTQQTDQSGTSPSAKFSSDSRTGSQPGEELFRSGDVTLAAIEKQYQKALKKTGQ